MPTNPADSDPQADGDADAEDMPVLEELAGDLPELPEGADASIEDSSLLADELTGRAASTDEDLTSLFRNESKRHFADGFHGGSDDDEDAGT